MIKPTHIAETSLYTDDLDRAVHFYIQLFQVEPAFRDARLCALRLAPGQVLLLFKRGASANPTILSGGTVPAHDCEGPLHVCFGIRAEEIASWEERLNTLGITVESRVAWPGGAKSLYFRDPDGHAVELATPGLWA